MTHVAVAKVDVSVVSEMFMQSVVVVIIAVVGASADIGRLQHGIDTTGPVNPLLGVPGCE